MRIPIVAALAFSLLWQAPSRAQEPAESRFDLTTPTGTIAGSLVLPAAPGKVPVVLIVAGSGPTDRDGNSPAMPGKNNAYKMLAAALAANGIASVRYDKRGAGESQAAMGAGESTLRFDLYVDDAAAWIARLRNDARFAQLVVIGHSEGSLVAMLAARRAKADAFVSIAGPGRRASDLLRDQLRPQLAGTPAWQASEAVFASLEAGTVVDPLPQPLQTAALLGLFRPSVQPYLISWIRYRPATELAALSVPVLIIQGTTDLQVDPADAKALSAAKPAAELLIVTGMNHVMKMAPADRAQNMATYSNPDLPIVPDVPRAIVGLVKRIARP